MNANEQRATELSAAVIVSAILMIWAHTECSNQAASDFSSHPGPLKILAQNCAAIHTDARVSFIATASNNSQNNEQCGAQP
ncbi:MAG: hypothetical protein EAZ21_11255 [Betaproteobacteria bacterium]|nr:MAG: hypothetical protein EAZ21_11255 [Betaproteobacteria bacterium]